MIIKSFYLFESKLEYLDSFTNVLKMMKSPISKSLLGMNGLDLNLVANFISVGGEDFVNFIPDKHSKEVKIIYRVTSRYGFFSKDSSYSPLYNEYKIPNCEAPQIGDEVYIERELDPDVIKKHYNHWRTTSLYHLKSLDGKKDHIYIPEGNNSIERIEKIIGPKPQQIKVGRLARNLLKITGNSFSDKDIEEFVNEFKSKYEILKNAFRNFHLVTGEEIRKWYFENSYYDSPKGPLHSSCMRYENCQDYLSLYVDNPDVCQLLILKSDFDNDKIAGRALIWKLDNGDFFMDRIYYSKDSEINLFIEFAQSNGWVVKSKQGSSYDGLLLNGVRYNKITKVNLSNFVYKHYPYLDTLFYLYPDGSLTNIKDGFDFKELRSADGGFVGGACEYCEDGRVECNECGGSGRVDCWKCNGDRTVECEDCGGDGDLDCGECDGSGSIDGKKCGDCNGSGRIKCGECIGGSVDCGECGGTGRDECGECNGNGEVDCQECNG